MGTAWIALRSIANITQDNFKLKEGWKNAI